MRWVPVLILVAGCNQLFGLKDVINTDAGGNTVPCSPLAFDAARYRVKASPTGMGLTWQESRDRCRYDGYDLAVLDQGDGIELSNESFGTTPPFWLGVSYGTDWTAIDGCMPELDWAPGEPSDAVVGQCVSRGQNGMRSDDCLRLMVNTSEINALCETPRPSVRCLVLQAERTYMAVPGTMDHTAAEIACSALGMHILEINSSDELDYVRGHFGSIPAFWLGAAKGGGTITSVTGCPQVFTWGPNDPDMNDNNRCTGYMSGAMVSVACDFASLGIICEMNSAI